MSDKDVVERAKSYLAEVFDPQPERYTGARGIVRELIAEVERLRGLEPGARRKGSGDGSRRYLRWKVADLRSTGEKLWSVVRLDNSWPTEVGKFPTLHGAWCALEDDRCSVLSDPYAVEVVGPQTYAEPGIW